MTNKVLLLFAHPSRHRSEINDPLFRAAQNLSHITAIDLYQEYPTYQIDIDREQQQLLAHDIIIFMFPLYWYSTPAILKEWQDLVLEYGFAYGAEGTALKNKTFFCVTSSGGPESVYQRTGLNHCTIRDLLQPLEQMAHMCGMTYWPPFILHGARTALKEHRFSQHLQDWQHLLSALTSDRVQLNERALRSDKLNDHLSAIVQEDTP
ncbi:MAG: NAD(P)H-dependent oxidoreductase [Thiolinea sp.]